TGIGLATPIGHDMDTVSRALQTNQHGIVATRQWDHVEDLQTRLCAPVQDLELNYPRKKVRTMGRLGRLAVYATEQSLQGAGLSGDALTSGRVGLAYGSTH